MVQKSPIMVEIRKILCFDPMQKVSIMHSDDPELSRMPVSLLVLEASRYVVVDLCKFVVPFVRRTMYDIKLHSVSVTRVPEIVLTSYKMAHSLRRRRHARAIGEIPTMYIIVRTIGWRGSQICGDSWNDENFSTIYEPACFRH